RPENAFILFRHQCAKEHADSSLGPNTNNAETTARRQPDLSKTVSQEWKAISPEDRANWEALAREKKRKHEALHPGYVYHP
ncbi:hypothetical protein B0H12DRAFT_975514, partial [Mycena haematopus]